MECLTPRKLLPLTEGRGIPSVLPTEPHEWRLQTNKPFSPTIITTIHPHTPSPLPRATVVRPPSTATAHADNDDNATSPAQQTDGDDLAHPLTCHVVQTVTTHVVVTVHINPGATSLPATWQPTTNDQQCPDERHESPSPLLFSHKKQPHRCRRHDKNEDQPPAKTYHHHPPGLTNDGEHPRTETGDNEPRLSKVTSPHH
ncbi:hypothetical protein K443DRAFT_15700 [Laccaria amethystina LaAM-08-1]|uniref:Uncharacterized protein n=1 Tax=Laccaria amethystina LaAM-08-1 TaxID=1095629 RepID=A0A0C9WQD3_9AGAR|nr:hypothetical protein K443DRAFT_15700 [Laccaria amethystina LaAM-08-1]